ncbi:MAG: menaquinone biosynthesis protein, partial [Alistipes sp.]|nr:menaquinone biosynthesis protein [Alistipes sp.]
MMANIPRIAAVSYLNTIPFIYGIRHEGNFEAELLLTPPSGCYQNYLEGKADIALMPSAMVPSLKSTSIITDYCIGSSGKVRTVVLFSNVPIDQVRRIFLDPHSRTSVQLAGYLAQKHWHIQPEWYELEDYTQVAFAQKNDAFLLIGDKVFDHEGLFNYSYDLSEEWNKSTRLPFAFAVWVARKGTSYEHIDALQRALTFGVES